MELFLRQFNREKFPNEHCVVSLKQNVEFRNKSEMHFDL